MCIYVYICICLKDFMKREIEKKREREKKKERSCLGPLRIGVLLYNIRDLQVFPGLRHGKDKALIWF